MLYGNNDWRDYLVHYGTPGMRWGVRNGPPYPIGATSSGKPRHTGKDDTERKKTFVSNLSKELDEQWSWGVVTKDGRRLVEGELDDYNFDRDYRTTPLKKLKKQKMGTCWDFVNYQHDRLKKAGIKDQSYLLYLDTGGKKNPEDVVTHTFTTFDLAGKKYWLESSAWPKRGIHEIKNPRQVVNELKDMYSAKDRGYALFKYNPEGMDKGLTGDEFMSRATKDENWVEDTWNGYLDSIAYNNAKNREARK